MSCVRLLIRLARDPARYEDFLCALREYIYIIAYKHQSIMTRCFEIAFKHKNYKLMSYLVPHPEDPHANPAMLHVWAWLPHMYACGNMAVITATYDYVLSVPNLLNRCMTCVCQHSNDDVSAIDYMLARYEQRKNDIPPVREQSLTFIMATTGHGGNIKIFTRLMAHVDRLSIRWDDTLVNAIHAGHMHMVHFLINRASKKLTWMASSYQVAHKSISIDDLSFIRTKCTISDERFTTAVLDYVCAHGKLRALKLINPSARELGGYLSNACETGRIKVVKYIIEHGDGLDYDVGFRYALKRNKLHVMKLLADKIDLNQNHWPSSSLRFLTAPCIQFYLSITKYTLPIVLRDTYTYKQYGWCALDRIYLELTKNYTCVSPYQVHILMELGMDLSTVQLNAAARAEYDRICRARSDKHVIVMRVLGVRDLANIVMMYEPYH
jgi:hypothetical protein